jgi:amidase
LFRDYDVVVTPVTAHRTPPIGHFSVSLPYEQISRRAVEYAAFCGLQNVTGSPAISLPLGTDGNGLPMGVQFSSKFGEDKLLLELAFELEEAKPWKLLG